MYSGNTVCQTEPGIFSFHHRTSTTSSPAGLHSLSWPQLQTSRYLLHYLQVCADVHANSDLHTYMHQKEVRLQLSLWHVAAAMSTFNDYQVGVARNCWSMGMARNRCSMAMSTYG